MAATLPDHIEQIRNLYDAVKSAVQTFCGEIRSDTGVTATVFRTNPITGYYDQQSGSDAKKDTLNILEQFNLAPDQEAVEVVRLPGVLYLSPEYASLIENVNHAKQELYQYVKKIPAGSRNRITRRALGTEKSMLQVYRAWHTLSEECIKVTFTEARKTSAITWKPVKTIRAELERSRNHPGPSVDFHAWNTMIDMELSAIADIHETVEMMIQKPVARHPRALEYHQLGARHVATYNASLPLLSFASPEQVRVKPFTKTKGYENERGGGHRKQLKIERLHVYYVPEGRIRPKQSGT